MTSKLNARGVLRAPVLCCCGLFANHVHGALEARHASGCNAKSFAGSDFLDVDKPTYTSPADEMYFASIGRLTISWAMLEMALDCGIILLHDYLGGKTLNPVRPWA